MISDFRLKMLVHLWYYCQNRSEHCEHLIENIPGLLIVLATIVKKDQNISADFMLAVKFSYT